MNEKIIRTLELNSVLEKIAAFASTAAAKDTIMSIRPACERLRIVYELDLLDEAVMLSGIKGRFPAGGYTEISPYVVHACKGGIVREEGLLKIASSLRCVKQIKRFVLAENASYSVPLLEEYASELEALSVLERDIEAAVISENELSDNASGTLSDIRRSIRNANASVKDKLNAIINSPTYRKALQEPIVTIRSGRYVVPVKNENRGAIEGIIHDSSSTGLTIFVEPSAVVALNNKIRELEIEEAKEIEIILRRFSERIGGEADYILNNERIVLLLDALFAKAEYAVQNGHTRPEINAEKTVSLFSAFHPLIEKHNVVASDIRLGQGYVQMVVTGPNTGGKTVVLKTLGLCVVMAQCALYIPAEAGSSVYVFDEIFADIGDEQSIAQSLSTFSSHMTNIVRILDAMNGDCMVLLDELGAGTDPAEGAALARAILEKIKACGALSAATTHYNEIKQYALTSAGVINASMEFDVANLKPTYRLHIGIPGKSNAFEISNRLGLGADITERACEVMSGSSAEFADIISKLETKLDAARIAEAEAKKLERENKKLNDEWTSRCEEIRDGKAKLMSEAAVEAKKLIAHAKKTASEIVAETEKFAASDTKTTAAYKKRIDAIAAEALVLVNDKIPTHPLRDASEAASAHTFKKGDGVYLPDVKADGIILDIEKDKALVQVGIIKTKVALSKLEPKTKKTQKKYSYTGMKAQTASSRLDIRGITATEVALEVEKFLDDASLAGLGIVTIVHGKGTGVLAKEVSEILKTHPLVESSRYGGIAEGGEGATIVYLQQ